MAIETEQKLNRIIYGKSEECLKDFPENFFDSVITDPPYEMNFMGKQWDSTGIAFNAELWLEVLRVVKPGSFLFCFGGTRTYHRVACAIEVAGWLIRDQLMWIYGEGFPKSCNISKAIDKEAGAEREVVEVRYSGKPKIALNMANHPDSFGGEHNITAPATNDAKRWDGYGTGLKPAWEPIIVAMKPLEKGLTYAQNAKKWGVAGLNIDGGRIDTRGEVLSTEGLLKNKGNSHLTGYKFSGDKTLVPNDDFRKGRWSSNVILSHSPDCVCVGTKQINEGILGQDYNFDKSNNENNTHVVTNIKSGIHYGQETIEVWACVPDCPIRIMDGQSGDRPSSLRPNTTGKNYGERNDTYKYVKKIYHTGGYKGFGGASRFFYCAKAKRSEKEAGLIEFIECVKCGRMNSKTHTIIVNGEKKEENCIRNNHPTVKPLDLMKYLCTLIKMPSVEENKQVILDPFCGSGSTLVAVEQLGMNYIGIDQDMDNVLISTGRIG